MTHPISLSKYNTPSVLNYMMFYVFHTCYINNCCFFNKKLLLLIALICLILYMLVKPFKKITIFFSLSFIVFPKKDKKQCHSCNGPPLHVIF